MVWHIIASTANTSDRGLGGGVVLKHYTTSFLHLPLLLCEVEGGTQGDGVSMIHNIDELNTVN